MGPIVFCVANARGEEAAWSCFFCKLCYSTVTRGAQLFLLLPVTRGAQLFLLLPVTKGAQLLLLLHFHVSTVHVNSGDMEVQKKKKKKENEGLGKTGKESNSCTKQTMKREGAEQRNRKVLHFHLPPALLLSILHYSSEF
jgi:hypothetical protein